MDDHALVLAGFAFVAGACVGPFLNVCIDRLPRAQSLSKSWRLFCRGCSHPLPWQHMLPFVSWLTFRRKCANCGAAVAFRHLRVELLTALLFLAVALARPGLIALPLCVFAVLLVVATFIDFEHFIIPDEITWGGTAAGLGFSLALPQLHSVSSPLEGALWSLAGAAGGYFMVWGVVEASKLVFGRKRVAFEKKEVFTWTRRNDEADFVCGAEKQQWVDMFARESDRLLMKCPVISIGGERFENADVVFHYDRVRISEREWVLHQVDEIHGEVTELVIPREGMGFGDVKFMACIGAFLGFKAVVFTFVAGSMVGSVVGILAIVMGRRKRGAEIPFGPYLSLGALLWVFWGPQLIEAYVELFRLAL